MANRIILSGLRSIEECLKENPDRIAKLLLPKSQLSMREEGLKKLARQQGVVIETNPKTQAEEPVLAILHDYQYTEFDHLVADLQNSIASGEKPVVLALDGVNDPQNLGAILRTAAFMGVDGIVIPKDRASGITETVYRVASGGMEHVRVSRVTNLVTALKALKEAGFWTVGFSEHASESIESLRQDMAPVIVIGNEEKGMRPLVEKNCDFLTRFPSKTGFCSLNASVAAALAMNWAFQSEKF